MTPPAWSQALVEEVQPTANAAPRAYFNRSRWHRPPDDARIGAPFICVFCLS